MPDLKLVEAIPLSMASREIAKIFGKRHDNVIRDIRKMLLDLDKTATEYERAYNDSQNRLQIEYLLPKNLLLTLILGYSVRIRYMAINSWMKSPCFNDWEIERIMRNETTPD